MNSERDIEAFIARHLDDDPARLALAGDSVDGLTGSCLTEAIVDIAARRRLRHKLPELTGKLAFRFPSRLSGEQCSSEATARLKARLIGGLINRPGSTASAGRAADLTGGLGVDTIYLSRLTAEFHYVEMLPELARTVESNFRALGISNIRVHNLAAVQWLDRQAEHQCTDGCETDTDLRFVYLDPARRDSAGRKVFLLDDCTPPVLALRDRLLALAPLVAVKLSPMYDITECIRRLRPTHIYIVSSRRECKELLAVMERHEPACPDDTLIEAIDIAADGAEQSFAYTPAEERGTPAATAGALAPGQYLLEPNAAIMKCGCMKTLARRHGVELMARDVHYCVSRELKPGFPGRTYLVEEVADFNKRAMAATMARVGRASIVARAFPLTSEQARARFPMPEGDEHTILLTRVDNNKKIILLKSIS